HYRKLNCHLDAHEMSVPNPSKRDGGNIPDPLGPTTRIAVIDPVYPIYVHTNVMQGHTGPADQKGEYQGLVYLRCTPDRNFTPELPREKVDIIYLCFPNNPTGAVIDRA